MYKLALIGAGRIGRIHAANAAAHPRLELALVVDPMAEAATELAGQHGARVADLDSALSDGEITGVIVASSTDTHLDYALRAAEAGKAVFCEKPLDLDLDRARAAGDRFAGLSAPLLLAFNRRFDPNFRRLAQELGGGAIGVLESLHIISNDPAPPPPGYIPVSGGLFKDMAIHDFDMARFLLGEEPSEVFASASCLVDPEIGRLGDVDTARTLLRTSSGKLCVISNSRRSGFGYDQRIEAFGSKGMLQAGNVTETTVQRWNEDGRQADRFQNFFLDRYRDAYRLEMDHFAAVLAGEAQPEIGYTDGLAALAIAEAAGQSARSGTLIKL
jgi:myo-inositol 2-dehydrogenase/D-chiro-inositol 1-dehydrogenase